MKIIAKLKEKPEDIKDLDLVEKIIQTLDLLYDETGTEYVFARIQSRMLGGACLPVPYNYKPSKTSNVLASYNKQYFEQKRDYLKRSA